MTPETIVTTKSALADTPTDHRILLAVQRQVAGLVAEKTALQAQIDALVLERDALRALLTGPGKPHIVFIPEELHP